jgi:glucose/arabinose dehydrogenase
LVQWWRTSGPWTVDDIILAKDGSILVVDDWVGAIYRISYNKK